MGVTVQEQPTEVLVTAPPERISRVLDRRLASPFLRVTIPLPRPLFPRVLRDIIRAGGRLAAARVEPEPIQAQPPLLALRVRGVRPAPLQTPHRVPGKR